jgi:hypothetical protein
MGEAHSEGAGGRRVLKKIRQDVHSFGRGTKRRKVAVCVCVGGDSSAWKGCFLFMITGAKI